VESILVQVLGSLTALEDTFIGFGVEVFLAAVILLHYRRFGPTLSSPQSFGPVLAFVALTTFLVISVIKSSFALSLGLVGALSIVRFRTPVKDPDELAYIFLAISSGIGTAAGARTLTLTIVLLILLVMVLMRRTIRLRTDNVFMSIDVAGVADPEEVFDRVRTVVRSNADKSAFMRYEMHDSVLHLTAALELSEPEKMARITSQIRELYPSTDVSFHDESYVPSP